MAKYTAASVAYADVADAYALCSEGDTLSIPAGNGTWGSQLAITVGITIAGAGIGITNITSTYAGGAGINDGNFLIWYAPATPANNAAFVIKDISFNMDSKCEFLKITSNAAPITKVRIHHNEILNTITYTQFNRGNVYGVTDHNVCTGGCFRFFSLDANWTNLPFYFGDENNYFVEDNTIDIPNFAIIGYGERGARYCIRHNTVTNSLGKSTVTGWDLHGNLSTTGLAGMGIEVYENVINVGGGASFIFSDFRGGKGMFWNNTVTCNGSGTARIREEHDDADNLPAEHVITGQPQHPSDTWFWGNAKADTTQIPMSVTQTFDYGGAEGLVPQEEREFRQENRAFDGSAGIGIGLLAARPSSGLTVGVGYWATDTHRLYRATSATEWEIYYMPYTYPHPLQGANPWIMIYG
jgi:hypothetical protein